LHFSTSKEKLEALSVCDLIPRRFIHCATYYLQLICAN
jgi:hypothetical protein